MGDALGMLAQIGYQWGWITSDSFGQFPWILFEGRVKVFLGASGQKSLLQLLRKPLLKYLPHVGTSSNYSLYNKLDPTLRRTHGSRLDLTGIDCPARHQAQRSSHRERQ